MLINKNISILTRVLIRPQILANRYKINKLVTEWTQQNVTIISQHS